MPKPNINDVLDVADPMLSDNYDLTFASVPGGGDNRQLTIQCKTAVKPGTTLTEVEVELFGHKVMHAAKREWSHDMSIEFIEDNQGTITRNLENWAEVARAHETQHGAFKADYAVDAIFKIYDQTGAVAMEYKIINCWPSEVPELSFDGSGGTAISLSATFKFDYVERVR
mgnify:CR=1 FL=1|tara:strand:- start:41459 stop:41968 length:510 start_codon:yes stop_codon:yes gene_type:complete